jgi:hypothetical protein
MIQCDKCNVWQHGPCMGIWDDDQAPDGESRSTTKGNRADNQNTFARNVVRISTFHSDDTCAKLDEAGEYLLAGVFVVNRLIQ